MHRPLRSALAGFAAAALTLMLGGCATVVSGTSHTVSITTVPADASCEVKRDGKVLGIVLSTPGTLEVTKTPSPLNIRCKKDGFEDAVAIVGVQRNDLTYANALLGGAVGAVIDANSGALNKYGDLPTIHLVPTRFQTGRARDEFFDAAAAAARSKADADMATIRTEAVCQDASQTDRCQTRLNERAEQRDGELMQIDAKRRRAVVERN